jgi:hypothetical protein
MSRAHTIHTIADAHAIAGAYIEIHPGAEVVLKFNHWAQADGRLHGGTTYIVNRIYPGFGEAFVTLHDHGPAKFPSHIFERA